MDQPASRVAEWRRHFGWTLKQLAGATGLHKATLHRIDTGVQRAREDELEKIAAAFGLSMAEFYGDIPTTPATTTAEAAANG